MNAELTEKDLLGRMENLEAELRRLKQLGLIAILAVIGAFLMGQAIGRQVIEARKIVIRHPNGKEAIVLETREDAALLRLCGSDGTPRVHLSGNQLGSSLELTPPKRTISLSLSAGVAEDGEGANLMIRTIPASGAVNESKPILFVAGSTLGSEKESSIYLYGKNGETIHLDGTRGQALKFLDDKDKVKAIFASTGLAYYGDQTMAMLSGGPPSLKVIDADGYATTIGQEDLVTDRTGEQRKTSAASVVLFGKDRKVIWRAP